MPLVKKGFGELIDISPVETGDGRRVVIEQIDDSLFPSVSEVNDPSETNSSLSSIEVFHSTLFDGFNLKISAVYNFYTADETINYSPEDVPLEEIPRFVVLDWKTCPVIKKSRRSFDMNGMVFESKDLDVNLANQSLANGFISPGVVTTVVQQPTKNEETRRIRFIDPGIVGAISNTDRVNKTKKPEHVSSVISLAGIMPALEIISEVNQNTRPSVKPPEVKTPNREQSLEYIGYVLEKYDVSNGNMQFLENIVVNDPTVGKYIDRKILYGKSYLYRIKSIAKWTRGSIKGFFGVNNTDLATQNSQFNPFETISSFYSSDWSPYSRADIFDLVRPDPPDEFRVDVPATNNKFYISWKIPWDPQKDISEIAVYRKVLTETSEGPWVQVLSSKKQNGLIEETDTDLSERSFVYSAVCRTVHDEESLLSEQFLLWKDGKFLKTKMISIAGKDLKEPVTKDINDPEIAKKLISVKGLEGYSLHPLFDTTVVLQLTSQLTGQRIDVNVDVSAVDIGKKSETTLRGNGLVFSTLKKTEID